VGGRRMECAADRETVTAAGHTVAPVAGRKMCHQLAGIPPEEEQAELESSGSVEGRRRDRWDRRFDREHGTCPCRPLWLEFARGLFNSV